LSRDPLVNVSSPRPGPPVSALPPPGLHASYSRQRGHGLRPVDAAVRTSPIGSAPRLSSTPGSPSEGRHRRASLSGHRAAPTTSSSICSVSCRPPGEQVGARSSRGKDAVGSKPLQPSSSLTGTTTRSSSMPHPSPALEPPPSRARGRPKTDGHPLEPPKPTTATSGL
jgi:hypothetical protein